MSLYDKITDDWRAYVQKPIEESHLPQRNYTLTITAEMEHSRGVAWSADLKSGSTLVAVVENAGYGGCNDYIIKDESLWHTFAMDAYVAYGNNSESKDALVQLLDVLTAGATA